MQIIEQDCFKVDISKLDKFNIFLYDGNHSYESQYKSLEYYYDCLDNEFIFITVDPYRDDVEQINNFLENFNSSIIGLTGSQKKVDDVIKNFRIFVKINGDKNDPNYLVDHSALFFLLDENDQYISHFRPNDFKYSIDKYF